MKKLKLFFGIAFLVIGIILSFTFIGAIIGIPLIVVGIVLLISWNKQKTKEMAREVAREFGKGLKESDQEPIKKEE